MKSYRFVRNAAIVFKQKSVTICYTMPEWKWTGMVRNSVPVKMRGRSWTILYFASR